MLRELVAASHLMSMEQLPGAVARHAADSGLHDVLIYASDVQQTVLRLLTGRGHDAGQDPATRLPSTRSRARSPAGRSGPCGR